MEKLLNELMDLKVEQLKFEVKFDKKMKAIMEKLNKLETKIEEIK